jgi:hypothetical protein
MSELLPNWCEAVGGLVTGAAGRAGYGIASITASRRWFLAREAPRNLHQGR